MPWYMCMSVGMRGCGWVCHGMGACAWVCPVCMGMCPYALVGPVCPYLLVLCFRKVIMGRRTVQFLPDRVKRKGNTSR